MELTQITAQILQTKEPYTLTPRQLFNAFKFARRTPKNCSRVDQFLNENQLMVSPHYNDVWIDTEIQLMPKPTAKTKTAKDPTKRLQILEAATRVPVYIENNAPLSQAIYLMTFHNYSQLPVTNNGLRGLCGYISWETIGKATAHGVNSGVVKDYKSPSVTSLPLQTPLLEAISAVYKHDFAVVTKEDQSICGIITTADISSQFLASTKPFLLLEEIENQIRCLFDDKFLLEDIKEFCTEPERKAKLQTIDDLTFGEYIRLIEQPKNWEKLKLSNVDKTQFIKDLQAIRDIRNDIMHFEPAGISDEQHELLKKMLAYLRMLAGYNKE